MIAGRELGSAYGRILLDMSALRRAAQESRVPLRQLEEGLEGTNRAARDAGQGSDDLARKMDRLKQQLNLQQRALGLLEKELEQTAQKYGHASTQAQKKQLALDRLLQSIENNRQKLQELERGLDRSSQAMERSSQAIDRTGRNAGDAAGGMETLRGGVGSLTGAMGALGIAVGAAELIQFGRDAIQAANDLEKSEAMLRHVAGSTERYNEVLVLAKENQLLFGGSLNEQLGGMRGITMMSERYGASLQDLTETFRLLNVTSPEQGIDGATVALKEFLSASDASGANSLAMRFEMDKGALKDIINSTPDATERLRLLREEMALMGVDAQILDSILGTTANTYDRLGVAIDRFTTRVGSLLARSLEEQTRSVTLTIDGLSEMLDFANEGANSATRASDQLIGASESYEDYRDRVRQANEQIRAQVSQTMLSNTALRGILKGLPGPVYDFAVATAAGRAGLAELSEEQYNAARAGLAQADATQQQALAAQRMEERTAGLIERARAAGDTGEALRLMAEQAALGADEVEELEKALDKALEGGSKAFAEATANENTFRSEREQAQADHTAKLGELEADYTERLNELLESRKEATTKKQREALDEQIADLKQSHADRKAAEEAAFAEREQAAAEAYAREQAAQLAHLGAMLMQYATAQAQMHGVSGEALAEMTGAIAREYGVQTSLTDRAFADMTGAIDAWVASGGQNADQYIGDLGRIRQATTETQQEVDRQIATMTEQAREDFEAGKITIDEYVEQLRKIPGAAEEAARGVLGIPTRLTMNVETTRAVADQRAGERAATPPPRQGPPRALGGWVAANSIQEVAEGERPELLKMGRKSFLLMGARGGNVVPADGFGRGGLAELAGGGLAPRTRSTAETAASGLGRRRGLAELAAGGLGQRAGRLAGLSGISEGLRAAGTDRGGMGLPAGSLNASAGLSVAPMIVINGLVVDNEARLAALGETIKSSTLQAAEGLFSRAVDQLILSGA